MGFRDKLDDILDSFAPKSRGLGAGIGSGGHGMVSGDDMIVSKPAIVLHISQIFFNFLALCCFASVAAFQAKWNVGPSGLSGFALFVSSFGILLSSFMLLVPVAYEKYNRLIRLAHALKEVRVSFILTGAGVTFSALIAFSVTVSAWTEAGCKNANNDPNAEANGDDFKNALPGWCSTKKAGAIFFWIAFLFWVGSLGMLVLDWKSGKLFAHYNPRDAPFDPPPIRDEEEEHEGEEGGYENVRPNVISGSGYDARPGGGSGYIQPSSSQQQPRRYSGLPPSSHHPSSYSGTPAQPPPPQPRPSMDAYGAFSDPAPTGFGASYDDDALPSPFSHTRGGGTGSGTFPEPDLGAGTGSPMVSRTMQYADPYAAVRASIVTGGGGGRTATPPQGLPPSYESYPGYR